MFWNFCPSVKVDLKTPAIEIIGGGADEKYTLHAGVHFSFDVLPIWDDQGLCAHKCVC